MRVLCLFQAQRAEISPNRQDELVAHVALSNNAWAANFILQQLQARTVFSIPRGI
jgi:hypothetical protein